MASARSGRALQGDMATEFGAYFRELRARLGLPLRQFCIASGYDDGNISKLEEADPYLNTMNN